jgi:glycosyltransferase involved in cell wall biosynthesis
MLTPSFTVIVPTRSRADTLLHTLRTCVAQQWDRLEILVSDNASDDNTADVVATLRDPRTRYVKTPRRLSMSHNWEFALDQVKDSWVLIVGDDDGLLPDALPRLARLLAEVKYPEIVCWRKGHYGWPNAPDPLFANELHLPLKEQITKRDGLSAIRDMLEFRLGYGDLPGLYSAAVNKATIDRVKARSGGVFFHSNCPDVYAAVALACVGGSFYHSNRPFSLAGTSHHSIGIGFATNGKASPTAQKFFDDGFIPFYPGFTAIFSMVILEAESFLQARRHFQELEAIPFSMSRVLERSIRNAVGVPAADYERFAVAIREIAANHGLAGEVESLLSRYPNVPGAWEARPSGYLPLRATIRVNASDYGVENIADAAILAQKLLESNQQFRAPRAVLKVLRGYIRQVPKRRHWLWAQLRARAF